ncbi:MAG TPA: ABC transporter ATP-binding protein [Clostridia bacterium]|nr:ABC transporter ATP-binding protein [Clostridia bacterium]
MLRLDGVSKVYKVGTFGGRKLLAVSNVSFDVQDGEVTSLIGESGSGKTTIGKMILHLASMSAGTIKLDGVDVSKLKGNALKEYYRKVQGVFQDPFSSYNPIFKADRIFRTIREEFFPGIGNGEWNTKIDGSLRAVGLNPDEVVNKFPHQLSGGQLQRFLIARALLLDVKFLVADEIISMLDASTRVGVLNLLADLKCRGLSILFITHDLSLGYYISEKSVILYRGRVVEMGPTEHVYHHPLHPYTKMLMACVPRVGEKWACTDVPETILTTEHSGLSGGCAYYDRCTLDGKNGECNTSPSLVEVEPGHFVACWH